MGHIQIFGAVRIVCFLLTSPRELIIGATLREPIISHRHNLVILTDNAGSHLGIGVFGTTSGQIRHTHKIFVPGNIIHTFLGIAHRTLPPVSFSLSQCPAPVITSGNISLVLFSVISYVQYMIACRFRQTVHDSLPQMILGKAFRINAVHIQIIKLP